MPADDTSFHLTRRHLLGAGLLAGALIAFEPSVVSARAADDTVTLTADGITVTASVGGRIAISNAAGKLLMAGSRFQTKDTVYGIQTSTGGTPSLISVSGQQAIRMDYVMPATAGGVLVHAIITIQTKQVYLEWTVSGSPTLTPAGFLFSRAVNAPTSPDEFIPTAEWHRDAAGGIPYEVSTGVMYRSTWAAGHGLLLLDSSRPSWTNTTWVHAPGVAVNATTAKTHARFVLTDARPHAGAAVGRQSGVAVEVWTDQAFNVWDAPTNAAVNVQVTNSTSTATQLQLSWWARTDEGVDLVRGTTSLAVGAASVANYPVSVPVPAEGIVVFEASASGSGGEAFARTNLAVIAPHSYQSGSDSMIGIANYPWLLVPSADALLDLWQKVGIQWVRIAYDGGPGLPPSALDARGLDHNIELQPTMTASDSELVTWANSSAATASASGATWFEVGNELNRPFNTGLAAQGYVERVLIPVHEARAAQGGTYKLMNNGLAGMDRPWVEKFHEFGGWPLVDAIAFHPGRGNFTPDYIPDGSGGEWGAGGSGNYWNYLGGLRQLKALMAEYGEKEIWMTEAYACTRPNAWWHDTYRHAAENVLLSLAIAKAEGVRAVCWYQFFDSVIGTPQGADEVDPEYHYGLINRDTSPKASLLAFSTAARVLDQATFVRWLHLSDGTTHGLHFDTPDGPVTILWNRADGYILNTAGARNDWKFPAPELWTDPWATKVDVALPAIGASVRQLDSFGRTTELAAAGGAVTLRLDGAPRVFYGLDLDGPDTGAAVEGGTAVVQPFRQNGHAALRITVTNDTAMRLDIRTTTPLGTQKSVSVLPGTAVEHIYDTGGLQLAAAAATIATYAWNDGDPVYNRYDVAYGSFDITPIG